MNDLHPEPEDENLENFDQSDLEEIAELEEQAADPKYQVKLQKLRKYINQLSPYDDEQSFIGKVACKGYGLGISEEDAVELIEARFLEDCNRVNRCWIESLVRGAREYAKNQTGERRRAKRVEEEEL